MKPTQTLAEAQHQLFESIRSLARHLVFHADSRSSHSDKGTFFTPHLAEKPFFSEKAHQDFLNALRTYAEVLVYDAYSRYDPYEGGEFLTHEAYEEVLESIADDEVIPMEDIAGELGIKW